MNKEDKKKITAAMNVLRKLERKYIRIYKKDKSYCNEDTLVGLSDMIDELKMIRDGDASQGVGVNNGN